jgi:putative ABC transport system permease protein
MHLFQNKQLGFDKEQVVIVKLYGDFAEKVISHPEIVKTEMLTNPDIVAVGKSSNLIGDDLSVESVTPQNPAAGKEYPTVRVIRVDENYLNVLNIKLKEGRNFSSQFNDSASFIINEKTAQALELKQPVGAAVVNNTFGLKGRVIGVIKDYNFASLHSQIEPLVLQYKPQWTGNLLVKIRPGKTAETIDFLKRSVEKISPNTLFSYSFLDDKIAALYKKEDNMSVILKVFSGLAIVISCLGLFGLAAFATETRTKEIGIRKVIGASVANLVQLLSANFILLVLIGNIIAWPLAWLAINAWLQEFSYKINIGYAVFPVSLIITVLIAMFTIGYQCIKATSMNPVKSLRTE